MAIPIKKAAQNADTVLKSVMIFLKTMVRFYKTYSVHMLQNALRACRKV